MIAQGGGVLRAIAPSLGLRRTGPGQSEIAGHRPVGRSQHRQGTDLGWAAGSPRPSPMPTTPSMTNTTHVYGAAPPQLASLAYDAVSLVALLSHGAALSPLHPGRADGPQRLCRRERHFPLQCRRHVGARLAVLEVAAGRLSCRQPRAQAPSRSEFLSGLDKFEDQFNKRNHRIQHQPALRRGAQACRRPGAADPARSEARFFPPRAACPSALR